MVEVRRANLADARGIAEVHVASWRGAYRGIMPDSVLNALDVDKREHFWRRQFSGSGRHTIVGVESEQVVGWVAFGRCRDDDAGIGDWEIYGIYLVPSVWRHGIGKLLWVAVLEAIRAEQASRVYCLGAIERNTGARCFYESIGGYVDDARKVIERDDAELPEVRYWLAPGVANQRLQLVRDTCDGQ